MELNQILALMTLAQSIDQFDDLTNQIVNSVTVHSTKRLVMAKITQDLGNAFTLQFRALSKVAMEVEESSNVQYLMNGFGDFLMLMSTATKLLIAAVMRDLVNLCPEDREDGCPNKEVCNKIGELFISCAKNIRSFMDERQLASDFWRENETCDRQDIIKIFAYPEVREKLVELFKPAN